MYQCFVYESYCYYSYIYNSCSHELSHFTISSYMNYIHTNYVERDFQWSRPSMGKIYLMVPREVTPTVLYQSLATPNRHLCHFVIDYLSMALYFDCWHPFLSNSTPPPSARLVIWFPIVVV